MCLQMQYPMKTQLSADCKGTLQLQKVNAQYGMECDDAACRVNCVVAITPDMHYTNAAMTPVAAQL